MENINSEQDLLFLIKYLNKLLAMDFDKRLGEYDLTGSQGRLLFYLNKKVFIEGEVIHQNDIEKRFGLSKSTVSSLVDRLAKKELIERVNDKPFVSLVPTEKGRCIVNHFHNTHEQTIEKLTSGLDKTAVENMISNIKLLIKNLEKEEEDVK